MTIRPPRGRSSPLKAPRPAALRPGAHPSGHARRSKPVRRASARLNQVRAGAVLVMLATAGALYGLTASSVFATRQLQVEGATWTGEAAVLAALGVRTGENLVTLRTDRLLDRVLALPAVRRASVDVALPDSLRIAIVEREPLLVWVVGERRLLVDAEGVFLAELTAATAVDAATLPLVDDQRAGATNLVVGGRLPAIDLDAATRLGSLTPVDIGSTSPSLRIAVDDAAGYVLRPAEHGWTAVFGFYTPTLRTPELIPGQVRLLRSFLIGREPTVQKVILADDRNGTVIPRPTPKPAPSASP